jgi:hypothetical protein
LGDDASRLRWYRLHGVSPSQPVYRTYHSLISSPIRATRRPPSAVVLFENRRSFEKFINCLESQCIF